MATPSTPAPASQAQIGTVGRLTGALFNPRATFEDIARKPGWIAPLLVLIVLAIGVTAVFGQRVGWRSFMEKKLATNKQVEQLSPADRQQAIDRAAKFAPIGGYVFAPVGIVVATMVIAGVLLGAFNTVAGAEMDFKTSLGITSHAWMPWTIHALLGLIVLFVKSPETIDIENLVASNPGALLSGDSPKWLEVLATSFDLFSFWMIFLLALGFSVARPKKISMGRALSFVVVIWAAYVLVKTGWAAAFS